MESVPPRTKVCGENRQANTYFKSQNKLTPRRAFLEEYDFEWEHKPGRHNAVPDALSRKCHEVVAALHVVESDFTERVKKAIVGDAKPS